MSHRLMVYFKGVKFAVLYCRRIKIWNFVGSNKMCNCIRSQQSKYWRQNEPVRNTKPVVRSHRKLAPRLKSYFWWTFVPDERVFNNSNARVDFRSFRTDQSTRKFTRRITVCSAGRTEAARVSFNVLSSDFGLKEVPKLW